MVAHLDEDISILIVDDDEVDRMALKRALKGAHFKSCVTEAVDADSAIEAIEKSKYDCFFLDYNLPGKNGLQLTQTIRGRKIKSPIIVLTGQGDEQTAVELMKAGASDYLPKSKLSSETLGRSVRSAMRVHQAESIVDSINQSVREKNVLLERKNRELDQQRRYIYQQNLRLQEVSRLKSEFLATMSHELRTPLNAIIGFSQILLSRSKSATEAGLTGKQQDMIGRILANGKSLLELINDILSFSKLEAGRLTLEPKPLDVVNLVKTTVEDLRSLADQKSLPLEVKVELSNPEAVNDAARLRQVVTNLLSNAIKFTDEGSVCVLLSEVQLPEPQNSGVRHHEVKPSEVSHRETLLNGSSASDALTGEQAASTSRDSGASSHIRLAVIDTGCGIKAEDQVNIFDPFHQADQRVTRRHAGTGLGLAITYSLVKMMNGSITLISEEDKGTTFTVDIPRVVVAQDKTLNPSELAYLSTSDLDSQPLGRDNARESTITLPPIADSLSVAQHELTN